MLRRTLTVISLVGLVVSILSFVYAVAIILSKLLWGIPITGWAPIMVSVLALSGIQMLVLGIIGEYLWRNYHETRRRPSFVVETTVESDGASSTEKASAQPRADWGERSHQREAEPCSD